MSQYLVTIKVRLNRQVSKETVVRRWESIAGSLVLTTGLKTVKGRKADVSSVSPSSERLTRVKSHDQSSRQREVRLTDVSSIVYQRTKRLK